jgi:aminoglycoside 6'-N-acetyltransferase I
MTIRPATSADLPAWYALRVRLWPDADSPQDEQDMRDFLDDPTWHILLAEADGQAVGFLEASLRDYAEGCDTAPVGYLEGWFVAEPYRRRGVGAALVRAAEAWARSRGCTEMASDAELHNLGSHRAHGALGYEEVERVVLFRKTL